MTIEELIERLENCNPEAEVRLMTQQSWPFENGIEGVCSNDDIARHEEENGEEVDKPKEKIVYIVEGSQIKYGSKTAWEVAE